MKFIMIAIVLSLLLSQLVRADTTFFDNPDDAFIMGNFSTTDRGITGGTTGEGGCVYNQSYDWKCSVWGECVNGKQTRNCKKTNNCENSYGKPAES
jgi:hypothetical protein